MTSRGVDHSMWRCLIVVLILLATSGCRSAPHSEPEATVAPTATASEQLYTCGMHPQVIRTEPGFCPVCGMALTPLKSAPESASAAVRADRTVRYWWDPMMSPPYISDRPGKSPMGMDLVPVYEDEISAGPAVVIDPVIVQNMGLRVATVAEGPLRATIRAAGYFDEAQPNQHDLNLRVSGWIERLYADTEGMHLHEGAPLFELYSPDLQVAIDELIAARKARDASRADGKARAALDDLYVTAMRKLRLLGLTQEQVDRLAHLERAPATVTFSSPVTGHLIEKSVVDGSAVKAGDRVMRIVDHGLLWLNAQIYEPQLPFIKLGQPATARVVGLPGRHFDGQVSFIHPHIEAMTRTAMVRVAVRNESLELRPGMYATVDITSELAPRVLLVPREAVIDTGTQQVAFVALPHGHFDPRTVTLGPAGTDGMVQVLGGLVAGEQVVISGQFLLDAESRFREGIQKFLATKLLEPAPGAESAVERRAPSSEAADDPQHH